MAQPIPGVIPGADFTHVLVLYKEVYMLDFTRERIALYCDLIFLFPNLSFTDRRSRWALIILMVNFTNK
jgi:hypothetical protein